VSEVRFYERIGKLIYGVRRLGGAESLRALADAAP
jgi:hypothetical protein